MTIHCNGRLIDLFRPKVMGILNLTPDSFFDGNAYPDERSMLIQVERMLTEGATFIDVGGYSSRPGADHISEETELQRVLPAVKSMLKHFPDALISVDTFRSAVAGPCLDAGAVLVNDISAGSMDEKMMTLVARYQVPYVMMHIKGSPKTMQQHIDYDDIVKEMLLYFSQKTALARAVGINDIIIDPGFGFAKTLEQNYEILNRLELFKITELPLLVGLSRKSMIYKLLETTPAEALNGTTSLNTVALLKGANILRVHDVKEAMECISLTEQLNPEE